MFKLMATFRENGEMSSTWLANVMSQDELLDARIVKTTFVAPLQVTKARLQEFAY